MKKFAIAIAAVMVFTAVSFGQNYYADLNRDSARSDKLTGGVIEKTQLRAGDDDIRITINIPSFQMTLWQNGKEVRTYPIGVGLKDHPLIIGKRQASSVEWNPTWIPPSSDWIEKSSTVKAGEIILPTDPRNPLGKVKIPLGYGYLIHQAKGPGDLGSLVSHGCVRVMQKDLYDLSENIMKAVGSDLSAEQIAAAKRTKKQFSALLEPTIPVEITYDTLVVENGRLHIYPDVYGHNKNTVENVRKELETSRIAHESLTDASIKKMIAAAAGKKMFVVNTADIEAGRSLAKGRSVAVIATAPARPRSAR